MSAHIPTYETSHVSGYARLFLLFVAVPLTCLFGYYAVRHQTGILCSIAAIVLLISLITMKGHHVLRMGLLVAMTFNILALAINPNNVMGSQVVLPPIASKYLLLICLAVASLYEVIAWVRSSTRETVVKTLAWGTLAIPALIYVIGIPAFNLLWETIEADEKKLALRDPNWTVINEASFRAAKFAIFAVFAYLGACMGSFLNVVAYCIPRGEAIGIRDSKCPKCNKEISRLDNLPIFSYINLGARCRNCQSAIPFRYLGVELIAGLIFGSLFLYELVTGCNNVPLMKVTHEGILWIILYPKWPAIGIYFYHALMMCLVLVLALMEWDKQPHRIRFAIVIMTAFFAAGAIYLPIQPVPLLEHITGQSLPIPVWAEQLLKLLAGAISGAALGTVIGKAFSPEPSAAIFIMAFSLAGMVLGWQALLQVTVCFAILVLMLRLTSASVENWKTRPTSILLAAVILHHPFWKLIADFWRFN